MAWRRRPLLALVLAAVLEATAISQDNSGEAFYAAIRANDLPRLNGMLTAGANVNARDERGITPLMYAAWVGSVDTMRRLLDGGADPNLVNNSGSTALMLSATDIAKVRLLKERAANVNLASMRGRTALFLAAMSDRSADIVRLLISAGADIHVVDGMKMTALHAAALGNDTETVRLLVDAGLDVNARDFQGFTPLIFATSNGNLAVARLLLARGAEVNAVSGDGSFQKVKAGTLAQGHFTPLIMAAPFGSTQLVKTLLDAGGAVNMQDIRGMTPLMLAVATDRQNPEVIRALIAKGADPNVKSLTGETALDWAMKIGATEAIDILKRAGGVTHAHDCAGVTVIRSGRLENGSAAERRSAGTDCGWRGGERWLCIVPHAQHHRPRRESRTLEGPSGGREGGRRSPNAHERPVLFTAEHAGARRCPGYA